MLSIEDNQLLTEVGPGKPMGDLLRWYWHPVCAVAELAESGFRTKEVRVLGEDLVVYRDRSGDLGMVAAHCVHRRAPLAYGIVEHDGIRCVYHGWKYDAQGNVLEQPYEDTTHPEDNYKDRCSIAAYPVQELAGLVWAYMGPSFQGRTPLLPRWAPMVSENSVRDIGIIDLPCSWLQCQENTLDPVHTEWLHSYGGDYFRSILKGEEPVIGHEWQHVKVGFDEFEYGIIKRRLTKGQTEDSDAWKIGHPMLFPNILLSGNPHQNQMQFRVPIDDARTRHFTLHTWMAADGAEAPEQDIVPAREFQLYDEQGRVKDLGVFFQQDYMVWAGQGDIAKRNLEKLGESDKGVILFRRQLMQQLQLVMNGSEPTINIFRDAAGNQAIELPIESFRFRGSTRYVPTEPGRSKDADKIEAVMATWEQAAQKAAAPV
jgi:5,5'-dehydrodivanillate O-demethylase oxygenase subunit